MTKSSSSSSSSGILARRIPILFIGLLFLLGIACYSTLSRLSPLFPFRRKDETKTPKSYGSNSTAIAAISAAGLPSNEQQEIMKLEQQQEQQYLIGKKKLKLSEVFAPLPDVEPTTTRSRTAYFNLNNFSGVLAKAFDPWPSSQALPCFASDNDKILDLEYQENTPASRGFLYMKPHKCASTTAAGINLRIARNVAKRQGVMMIGMVDPNDKDVVGGATATGAEEVTTTTSRNATTSSTYCENRFTHSARSGTFRAMRFQNRIRKQSYLWTLLREPTKRYTSFYFYRKIRPAVKLVDSEFQQWIFEKNPGYYYLCTLATKGYDCTNAWDSKRNISIPVEQQEGGISASVIEASNEVISEYDFIGIVERFDESIVVMTMLLGIPMADVLYISSKLHGGFRLKWKNGNPFCQKIPSSYLTDGMKEFYATDMWQRHIKSDLLLYQAANRSLDLTIERLGREEVERNVALLQQANSIVAEQCSSSSVVLPCDTDGAPYRFENESDCLHRDIACGMDCLDTVADRLNLSRFRL